MSQGLYDKVHSRLYTIFLLILYFFTASLVIGTMVWASSCLIRHPLTLCTSIKIGTILGGIDFYFSFVCSKSLQDH